MSKKLAALFSTITYFFFAALVFAQDEVNLEAPDGSIGRDVKFSAVPQLIINLIFGFAMFLAVVYLMLGGIKYMTARGDKSAVESARKHLFSAVIGVVIVAGSFFILNVLFGILGADNPLSRGWQMPNLNDLSR